VAQPKIFPLGVNMMGFKKCNIRQYRQLAKNVSTNQCAGIVGNSYYISELSRSINSKWAMGNFWAVPLLHSVSDIVWQKCANVSDDAAISS
jgi:hypothetical protein